MVAKYKSINYVIFACALMVVFVSVVFVSRYVWLKCTTEFKSTPFATAVQLERLKNESNLEIRNCLASNGYTRANKPFWYEYNPHEKNDEVDWFAKFDPITDCNFYVMVLSNKKIEPNVEWFIRVNLVTRARKNDALTRIFREESKSISRNWNLADD